MTDYKILSIISVLCSLVFNSKKKATFSPSLLPFYFLGLYFRKHYINYMERNKYLQFLILQFF